MRYSDENIFDFKISSTIKGKKNHIIALIDAGYTNKRDIAARVRASMSYTEYQYNQYINTLSIPDKTYNEIIETIKLAFNKTNCKLIYHTLAVKNTAKYLLQIKEQNGKVVNDLDKKIINIMCLLHDIGKINIKSKKMMETHPEFSYIYACNLLYNKVHPWIYSIITQGVKMHSDKNLEAIKLNSMYGNTLIEADILSKLTKTDIMGKFNMDIPLSKNISEIKDRISQKVIANKKCLTSEESKKYLSILIEDYNNLLKNLKNMIQ